MIIPGKYTPSTRTRAYHEGKRTWTRERIEELRALKARGLSVEEIAEAMGITPYTVKLNLYRYGDEVPSRRRCGDWWTKEDIAELTAFYTSGMTMRDIVLYTERGSIGSIYQALKRFGIYEKHGHRK